MTNRWIVNGIGQYIDADAVVDPSTTTAPAPPWGTEDDGTTLTAGHSNSGLSDDLARLKISAKSEADAQLEPPSRLSRPSSKLTNSSAAAVAQTTAENNVNNTSSPLDSSSSNSSSSPHTPDHTLLHHPISHSRGASADTPHHHHVLPQTYIASQHSHQSNPSSGNNRNTNLLTHHQHALKTSTISTADSSKERPRSFSGSISTTDHRRLSQGGPAASPITDDHDRQPQSPWGQEQLSYPSLATQQQRPFHHNFNYSASNDINTTTTTDDDQHYTRAFSSVPPPQAQPHPHQLPASRAQFIPVSSQARPVPVNYRRTYTPQGPSPLGYGHHTTHHSLGNTQQLYEMMLPAGLGDAHHLSSSLSRGVGLGGLGAAGGNGIQQSPVFRATHHHSASDPSALRDPTTLALLNNNMQTFAPGMFQPGMHTMHPPAPPPPSIYPGQYYAQEMAMQQLLNARIQAAQAYTGPYGMATALSTATVSTPQPTMSMDNVNSGLASPGSSNGGNGGGPSANNRKLGLYKTELCRSWEEKGSCRYGAKCQFAHGEEELRRVARHPKYKTEICKTFWVSGSCPYGKRCCFIHTELSAVQTGPNANSSENAPQPSSSSSSSNGNAASNGIHSRERSNSDPDTSASVSLLTRISQRSQHNQETPSPTATTPSSNPTPSATTAPSSFSLSLPLTSRPPTGSLRVDTTNVEPNLALKQNKSAYPTFASNGILLGGATGAGGSGSLDFGGNSIGAAGVTAGSLGDGGRGLGAGVGVNGAVKRFRHDAVPVTAGPDLGRHNLARMEIVGYPTHQRKGSASSITNAHHSLSGSDIDLSFSPSPPGTSGHSYSLSTSSDSATSITNAAPSSALSPAQPVPTRFNGHGHARTGSAGTLNWGSSFTSSGGSSSASRNSIHHPLSTSVGSTWVGELTARVGNEKTWA